MFSSIVRGILARLSLSEGIYNTHSFRIGAATAATEAQIPETHIKMLGRWRRIPALHTNTGRRTRQVIQEVGIWSHPPPLKDKANCSPAKLLTVYIIYKHTQYINIVVGSTPHILYVPLCNFTCITRLPANYSCDNNYNTLHKGRKHSCTSVYFNKTYQPT